MRSACAGADAGADLHFCISSHTKYDFVQIAANAKDLEAALKLVEAGAKWHVPKGQRVMDGLLYYPPKILATMVPHLKVRGSFSSVLG
jgi:hypothetical protein